ncbi:MAG: dihydroneopterin aldolase [Proteobacteria bacterium]|nr:dihydroneopterin aldolase [Pseudomonadota bacterium]
MVEAGHIELVESFANRLAALCLNDASVRTVTVRVEKPEAIPGAEGAGIEITRRRSF